MTREEIIEILNKEFWSTNEVAKLLGTTRQNLTKLKREKALVPVRSDHAGPIYLKDDIVSYMDNYCNNKQKRSVTKEKYQNIMRAMENEEEV